MRVKYKRREKFARKNQVVAYSSQKCNTVAKFVANGELIKMKKI